MIKRVCPVCGQESCFHDPDERDLVIITEEPFDRQTKVSNDDDSILIWQGEDLLYIYRGELKEFRDAIAEVAERMGW